MFSVHTTPEDFVFEENSAGKSHDHRDAIVFEKFRFQNIFRPHENENPAFPNSSGLKSVFELVWTVSLTVEIKFIKLRF